MAHDQDSAHSWCLINRGRMNEMEDDQMEAQKNECWRDKCEQKSHYYVSPLEGTKVGPA